MRRPPSRRARLTLRAAAALGSAVAVAACDGGRARVQVDQADADNPHRFAAGPSLAVSEPSHAFGHVVQGSVLRTAVTVTNLSRASAQLTTALSGQRCGGRLDRASLAPGENAALEVTCTTDRHRGPLRETVLVRAGSASADEVGIEVTALVEPLVALATDLLAIEMRFGEERTVDVHLVGSRARQAHLVLRDPGDPDLTVTFVRVAPGEPATVRVRARGDAVGVHVGSVVIGTDVPGVEELTLPYSHKVTGTLMVSPTNPYINLRERGTKSRTIAVQSSQAGFRVSEATIAEGPFAASLERSSDGSARVRVTVVETRLEDETRGAVGRLVIRSNDRSEPTKEVPLLAFGTYHRAPDELQRPDQ